MRLLDILFFVIVFFTLLAFVVFTVFYAIAYFFHKLYARNN